MPEMKNTFTSGKMNKDLDERLVPNGEYRDAMNVEVSSSESSEVGTVQNILGNQIIDIANFNINPSDSPLVTQVIGAIADEKIDTLYYLVWTNEVDYIISYKRGDASPEPVLVDTKKNTVNAVLNFTANMMITGINVIDEMLFFTDNKNEPKKINITQCKAGTPNFTTHTKLINENQGITLADSVDIEEKHITMIRKAPKYALSVDLETTRPIQRDGINQIYTGVIWISTDTFIDNSFLAPSGAYDFSFVDVQDTFELAITDALDAATNIIAIGDVGNDDGLTGWHKPQPDYSGTDPELWKENILPGTKVVLKPFDSNGTPPGIPVTDFQIKGVIEDIYPDLATGADARTTGRKRVRIKATTIDGFPDGVPEGYDRWPWTVDIFEETERLYEFKFPRFSYRYKFKDGEYSPFAPFTQVVFAPGAFDYHPRKGYNLGMTNTLKKVFLKNIVTDETPKDVISIDILFKDEVSPVIYVVETIRPDDSTTSAGGLNLWDKLSDYVNGSGYEITKETINSVVPSNQLLRLYDNVPRKALAQDVTGNRVVYANYIQNYDLIGLDDKKYYPGDFKLSWDEFYPTRLETATNTTRSIKSLREYQVGVVFTDKYGRETPVLSNTSSSLKLEKDRADRNNRIKVGLKNSDNAPKNLSHFKFYVKETAGEYYNMAMDRFYDARDGNIWLAFASSDRNKVDIDSFLILKKGSDQDELVKDAARYKVIAIENEAPDFIKTKKLLAAERTHTEGSISKELFGTGLVDVPLRGRDEFKLRYRPFHGSPAQTIADYDKGQLWIEFGRTGSTQTSDRYRISSIAEDHDATGGSLDGDFSIQIERPFSDDIDFISDDPTGVSPNGIEDGVIVRIYKYEVENGPQFDGRFFVKIYRDETFNLNIGKSFIDDLPFRRIESRKVYSMYKKEHHDLITKNLGPVDGTKSFGFTDGYHRHHFIDISGNDKAIANYGTEPLIYEGYINHSSNTYDIDYTSVTNDSTVTTEVELYDYFLITDTSIIDYGTGAPGAVNDVDYTWGHYLLPNFLSWNFFFYRFIKSSSLASDPANLSTVTVEAISSDGPMGYTNWAWQSNTPSMSQPYFKKVQIERDNLTTGRLAGDGVNGPFKTKYKNVEWEEIDNWWTDCGVKKPSDAGFGPGNFDRAGVPPYGQFARFHRNNIQSGPNGAWNLRDGDGQKMDRDTLEDVGVWFIDRAPFTSDQKTQNNLFWTSAYGDGGGLHSNHDPDYGGGLSKKSDYWKLDLSFGPIIDASFSSVGSVQDGFWNIGDWNTPDGEAVNTKMNEPWLKDFVQLIQSGAQFRWAEDPSQTIYTIGGDLTSMGGRTRYSSFSATSNNKNKLHKAGGYRLSQGSAANFSKHWEMNRITPLISGWDPMTNGEMSDAMIITLTAADASGNASGSGATITGNSSNYEPLVIYTKSINGPNSGVLMNDSLNATIHEGMALKRYTKTGDANSATIQTNVSSEAEEFLIVYYVEEINSDDPENKYFAIYLGGYTRCLDSTIEYLMIDDPDKQPKIGGDYVFTQVGMNSMSPNSEFNINTNGQRFGWGAMGAVGYTLEFVEAIEPEEIISENPAIFETEPKDVKELDIYYEASAAVPYNVDSTNIHEAFPVGSYMEITSASNSIPKVYTVIGYRSDTVLVDPNPTIGTRSIDPGDIITIIRPDNLEISIRIDSVGYSNSLGEWFLDIKKELYTSNFRLPWYNCFSFGNGVESNRIRDNFNLPFISNGVRVSTTLETGYEEEHRKYGLIYSGIYNSVSGVNNLNQFIAAEKITKDVNPIYGSIQKLHSRDTDLVTLCEDKVLKILSNKDAVFNADGNTNLTATENVLGQTIPFVGEYGISTNPESFAAEAYRAYFSDKVRGTIMRLSRDGLTPISDHGMKDWFRDNLKLSNNIKGSYDDRKDEYNVKLENYSIDQGELINNSKIVTFKEDIKGWVSFKSFIDSDLAISMGNDYYSFNYGRLYKHHVEEVARNTFYNTYTNSSIDVLLNANPSLIKVFSTLNYEGSQAKVDKFETSLVQNLPFQPDTTYSDQEYYNLSEKQGWHVESIMTNKESGYISEFLDKESKWFNYINKKIDFTLLQADAGDFSFQGIGQVISVEDNTDDIIITDFDLGDDVTPIGGDTVIIVDTVIVDTVIADTLVVDTVVVDTVIQTDDDIIIGPAGEETSEDLPNIRPTRISSRTTRSSSSSGGGGY